MFDFGWAEILVVAVIGLIVIGPKELPRALYTCGQWLRKARTMGRQVQRQFDDFMRDAELDELRDQAKSVRRRNVKNEVTERIKKTADPEGDLDEAGRSLNPRADVDRDTVRRNAQAQRAREGRGQASGGEAAPAQSETGGESHNADAEAAGEPVAAATTDGDEAEPEGTADGVKRS